MGTTTETQTNDTTTTTTTKSTISIMDNPTMINNDEDVVVGDTVSVDQQPPPPPSVLKDPLTSNPETIRKPDPSSTWVKFDDSPTKENVANSTELEPDTTNRSNRQNGGVAPITEQQPQQQFATIDLSTSVEMNHSNLKNTNEDLMMVMKKNDQSVRNNDSNNSGVVATAAPTKSGFANGDIIVTLYPLNDSCAWITPATFKAHLVPEELMAQPLTLTVEDYVSTMSILLSDYRFHLYITLHKRILAIWITLSIIVLLGILASGNKGLSIFLAGILWLVLNAMGIFFVIFIKHKLNRMLEDCLAQVNAIFAKHNIFLGVDDRGHFSCHKINLIFVYFDSKYCLKFLQDMLKNNNYNGGDQASKTLHNNQQTDHFSSIIDGEHKQDEENIYITGSSGIKQISQKEKQAEKLLYRYSQRWIREYGRQRMTLSVINPRPVSSSSTTNTTVPITPNLTATTTTESTMNQNSPAQRQTTSSSTTLTINDIPPRHCRVAKCFCQYIEELYRYKHNLHRPSSTTQHNQQQKQSSWYTCLLPSNWFNCI